MNDLDNDSHRIAEVFHRLSGTQSLNQRLAEILAKATAASRFGDIDQLRVETGDLLCSLLQLCNQCGWVPTDLVSTTLANLEAQHREPVTTPLNVVSNRQVALYAASFDPPTRSQRDDIRRLKQAGFDEVVICPLGPKVVAGEHQHAAPQHRAALVTLGFRGLDDVLIDYDDISHNRNTSVFDLMEKHQHLGQVWQVLDASDVDVENPLTGSRAVVFYPAGVAPTELVASDNLMLLERDQRQQSYEVRKLVYSASSIEDWVVPLVAGYIERHQLFIPYSSARFACFKLPQPRLKIVADTRNPKSMLLAEKYKRYESPDPELILVLGGDGSMLHAIREHWRLRVPFVGLNTGHLGFLMNERLPDDLTDLTLVSHILPMLRVDAETASGVKSWGLAFSDVWVERADGQAAWLRLDVDGETRVSKVVGDGMLVATASGSSAYARAMGAIPIPLNTPVITLAGSNIFQPRFWKPMTLPDDSLVTLASLDRSGKRPLKGFIDGTPMGEVQQLTVKRSLTASIEMAFTHEFDPSARLLRSLFPPDES